MTFHTTSTFVSYNHSLKEADVLYLGIPFCSTSLSKPAMFGHVIVRQSLKMVVGTYKGTDIFRKHRFCDLGEIEVVAGSYEKTRERIKDTVAEILAENPGIFPIFVGGEHLITLPLTETLKPKTIIQFDAHGDMLPEYDGVAYSHATWAYHASKNARLIQIGVSNYEEEESEAVKKHNVTLIKNPEQLAALQIEHPIHLTIDMDVFHPAYVEAGFPEGVMNQKEFFAFLEKINPDSLDVVEISDDRLISKTGFLAAEIIKNVLGRRG